MADHRQPDGRRGLLRALHHRNDRLFFGGQSRFPVDMVEDRADLPNAIALNSSMVNAAHGARPATGRKVLHELQGGFRYAFGFTPIRAVLLLLAVFVRQLPRLRAAARPVYVEKGILPAVARGLESATALGQEGGS